MAARDIDQPIHVQISDDELKKHEGKWVAFDSNRTRIIASHDNWGELDRLVVQAGFDPEEVAYERLVGDDSHATGAQLH